MPVITVGFIVINVVIFLVMEIGGTGMEMKLMRKGALLYPDTLLYREWYRLLTACFLHFGFRHVVSNMFMLAVFGERLERLIGRAGMLVTYLFSGLGGTAASLFYHHLTDTPVISAGASGAIYGVVGAMLAILLVRGGLIEGIGVRRMLFMVAFMIYTSTIGDEVDVAAHIGGLLAGFLMGLLLVKLKRFGYNKKDITES